MKLTIVGGGGFRVPLVYGALLARKERLGLDEVVLYDIDEARQARIGQVLEGLAAEKGVELPFRTTTDLVDAVSGADFVFCAIRVGQLEGRVIDEDVPLGMGVLGQETTGPGGICFALRTIPVMTKLAETMAEHSNGWLINFTNPAGMVTEACQRILGDKVIGICDSPSGMCRRVAAVLGRDPKELWFHYFGLNHLGWLTEVRDGTGAPLLDTLLADDAALERFEEGRLFGGEWLRTLGMLPNEYLYYFYYAADTVNAIRGGGSRGAFLLQQQREFYARNGHSPKAALEDWRTTRHDRERTYMAEARAAAGQEGEHDIEENSGYESEAMAVVDAIVNNTREVLILNTANRSALPFLDERAVVEVPCVVGRHGPVPVAIGEVPAHASSLISTMKDVERTTIEAALTGSEQLAIKALALHPLVPSVSTAREIFDGYRRRLPALAEAFA
ncbi:6-phospho-beta-glucosidase [Solirubrobacter sp. CPCC 204708]|uniref:6-phospho-beta-glucosidase n=1 Tax=Solirubrobacter deserti TaxID=2282478 RepID=A0ABT4RGB6_9ACTN|nr:6-phospho-beta-glucosidase [Solirubrobacter deserti]MBE2319673.1 6-phospho-beta-glucosidase [Solirubrobacter deserti]MDA0137588.1 6-phospho-beta-glucosidase [Solirubrobacter deserti]